MGQNEHMRDEREVAEIDYEALTTRCARVLRSAGGDLENLVHAAGARLDEEGVVPSGVALLETITAVQETVEESAWVLAKDLHGRGVPYRVLAEALHTSVMTVRRKLTEGMGA